MTQYPQPAGYHAGSDRDKHGVERNGAGPERPEREPLSPLPQRGTEPDVPEFVTRRLSSGRNRGNQPPPTRPLRETPQPPSDPAEDTTDSGAHQRVPYKLMITGVVAVRGVELTEQGVRKFQRATKADGADESGLTARLAAITRCAGGWLWCG